MLSRGKIMCRKKISWKCKRREGREEQIPERKESTRLRTRTRTRPGSKWSGKEDEAGAKEN